MVGAGIAPVGALKIERVETVPVRVPLQRTYRGSQYHMTHRSTIVTRIHTTAGLVGEAYAGDEDASLEEIDRIIHRELAPLLEGEDAFGVERLWQRTRPATKDILRDRRLGLVACACVDAAVWDLIGKALGQPLWRLWGGFRREVPVISIGGYYGTEVSIPQEVEELQGRGLAGMKFKVGGMTPEEDAARFLEARAAAGDGFVLMADANQAWSPDEAVRFARLVEEADLHWFEEPCRWDNDRLGMRDVRYRSGARVCAGQSEFSAAGCRDLMAAGAIDFCNFDASWSGGPTEWRRVAAMSLTYDVAMAHHEEPQVASHLLASIPNGSFLEWFHPERDPIWHHLVANAPALLDGHLALSERPGLGWELDEDYIDAHRLHFDHHS
jgi:D-galactarolactone cycloisomerase